MLDLRRLLSGLTQTIGRADFPDATALAEALDFDLSRARVTKTKKGNLAIRDAHLNDGGLRLDIACGVAPRHDIWLLVKDSALPYRNIKDEIFGADQRIQRSKFSAGFGVLFEIDGWTCGFTAPSPDGDVIRAAIGTKISIRAGRLGRAVIEAASLRRKARAQHLLLSKPLSKKTKIVIRNGRKLDRCAKSCWRYPVMIHADVLREAIRASMAVQRVW